MSGRGGAGRHKGGVLRLIADARPLSPERMGSQLASQGIQENPRRAWGKAACCRLRSEVESEGAMEILRCVSAITQEGKEKREKCEGVPGLEEGKARVKMGRSEGGDVIAPVGIHRRLQEQQTTFHHTNRLNGLQLNGIIQMNRMYWTIGVSRDQWSRAARPLNHRRGPNRLRAKRSR